MALTSSQIASTIRRKVQEITTDLVTDDTLFINMNLAYDDIKLGTFTPDQIKTITIALTNGIGTLPIDFGTSYGVGYKDTQDKTPFEELSIADFDRDIYGNNFTIKQGQLYVHPVSTSQLILSYYPSYTELSVTQNPQINPYLNELIIYGALYRILQDLQDDNRAEYYREYYDNEFKRRTMALSNYQEDNTNGGSLFNGIRII